MTSDPERIRSVLDDVGRSLGLGSPADVGKVWAHWREIVGASIADHADPTSLRGGVLRVRADSPAWATEIGYLGDEIAARINQAVSGDLVSEVRVWIGPRRERSRSARPLAPGPSRAREDAPPADPEVALERARNAWARNVGSGHSAPSAEAPENQEKRR